MIPLDVGMLIRDRRVDSDRIEYVWDWDQDTIAHTVCAFANDIENVDGGYIIIGIREENGTILDINDLSSDDISRIEDGVGIISDNMSPGYEPRISIQ